MTTAPARAPISSGRLALYLAGTWNAGDEERITSAQLAAATGINPTQVRRDLSQVLGPLGKRGAGYPVTKLARELEKTLAPHAAELQVAANVARERANQLEQVAARLTSETDAGRGDG